MHCICTPRAADPACCPVLLLPPEPSPLHCPPPQPEWLPAKAVSAEVIEDFESGLEYSDAACIVKMRQRGTARAYLVR